MKLKVGLLSILVAVAPASGMAARPDCEGSGAFLELCLKMQTLKSQLDILDEQRDLVQLNYPFLQAIGSDVVMMARKLQSMHPGEHLGPLKTLENEASQMVIDAKARNSASYGSANMLKSSCLVCHSNVNPASGYRWADLAGVNWDKVTADCNGDLAHGRVPFLCKSMYGMKTMVKYFEKSGAAAHENLAATGAAAGEIGRIASGLKKNGVIHGGDGFLAGVANTAQEVQDLANKGDGTAFLKARVLNQSCLKCHAL